MSTDRPFPPPRFFGLLWMGWWLALAWLAGIAWHEEPAPMAKPAVPVPMEKVVPPRPAFEDMQAFTADQRFVSFEQWQTWLDQSQQALNAARHWGNANYQLKELESNLQLLSTELLKQLQASRSEAVLDGVLFRLSRSNPQLRLYEQERVELERTPADLSRLMLRLFAIALASENLVPNAQAFEAACPVWGELSQSLTQLQKELETSKGRRLDLARRSLSVFDKPDLTVTIHAHAKQCTTVVDSRKAVTTLTRALQQVAWDKVFVAPASVAASQPPTPTQAAEPSPHVLARQWMPAALTLALICTVLLAWGLRVRSQRLTEQWDQIQEHRQRLQSQLVELRAKLTQNNELDTALAELPPPLPAEGTPPIIEPTLHDTPRPPRQAPVEDLTPIRRALAAASEKLRNVQLALIQGSDKNQVLQELQYVQALLEQTGQSREPADGASA